MRSPHGHDVVGSRRTRRCRGVAAYVDVVFNIAEGKGSRSREAQVPALLDLLGIPYTGSDAVALGVTLDKSLAKAVVGPPGMATPLWTVMTAGDEPLPGGFQPAASSSRCTRAPRRGSRPIPSSRTNDGSANWPAQ